MTIVADGDRTNEGRVYAGQGLPGRDRPRRELHEVEDLTHDEPETPAGEVEDENGAFVVRPHGPAEEGVTVSHRQQAAADVDQPFHGKWHAGNAGGGQPRQHLPNPGGRRGAHQIADAEYDGRKRVGFTHVY